MPYPSFKACRRKPPGHCGRAGRPPRHMRIDLDAGCLGKLMHNAAEYSCVAPCAFELGGPSLRRSYQSPCWRFFVAFVMQPPSQWRRHAMARRSCERLQSVLGAGANFSRELTDMIQMVRVSIACLLLSCGARAGAAGDSPSFMMVSGISASDEMCLTAADGTCPVMLLPPPSVLVWAHVRRRC